MILGTGALDIVNGLTAAATLTNVNNQISGSGQIGAGELDLVNQTMGLIEQTGTLALMINTGANQITNAGTIEATGSGGATILSAVVNTGLLKEVNSDLTMIGAVTGSGSVVIQGGTLSFDGAFSGKVSFAGSAGELVLAKSQSYAGTVSGFSRTGGTILDLRDIGFVSASEATFKSGVLTASDGTHTAKIALAGNFGGTTFVASSDGQGGVLVVDGPSPDAFVSAMAGLGAGMGSASTPSVSSPAPTNAPRLASPVTH